MNKKPARTVIVLPANGCKSNKTFRNCGDLSVSMCLSAGKLVKKADVIPAMFNLFSTFAGN